MSSTLIRRFDDGGLDLVFCKRWTGDERGDLVWRDRIAWAGRPHAWRRDVARGGSLPLIAYPPPSLTRTVVLDTLSRADTSAGGSPAPATR